MDFHRDLVTIPWWRQMHTTITKPLLFCGDGNNMGMFSVLVAFARVCVCVTCTSARALECDVFIHMDCRIECHLIGFKNGNCHCFNGIHACGNERWEAAFSHSLCQKRRKDWAYEDEEDIFSAVETKIRQHWDWLRSERVSEQMRIRRITIPLPVWYSVVRCERSICTVRRYHTNKRYGK